MTVDTTGKGLYISELNAGYDSDVVKSVTLSVVAGEIVTLIGPNGSGKSTLLKTVAGLLRERGGVIYLNGRDKRTLSAKETASTLSLVMTGKLDPELMTCRNVIESGRYPYTGMFGRLTAEDVAKVDEAIAIMDATDIADNLYTHISDGQRQRVLLARALAQDPDILVLDEPTSYLDIRYKIDILTRIREIARSRNIAVLLSLHEPEIAMKLSDTVVAIGDGRVLRMGSVREVFREDFIRKLYKLGDMDTGLLGKLWVEEEPAGNDKLLAGHTTNMNIVRKTDDIHVASTPISPFSEKSSHIPNIRFANVATTPISSKSGQIMIQGTMSSVGKSVIAAALCRIFAQDGYSVAPFKSQNMANNSFVTGDGLEMGRAQVMQALCANTAPDVRMNPVLLKPTDDTGSQVVVMGKPVGNMRALQYFEYKKSLVPVIKDAYDSLSSEYDIIVIEGAGSPAEINLKDNDIVNMGLAKMVKSPVLLVGDIDRGGVFAQLTGTLDLLPADERELIKGLVINKFRGDVGLLKTGIDMLEAKACCPVTGIIPYMDINLDDEDSVSDRFNSRGARIFDIAVVKLPHIANFTDFDVFEQSDEISVRYVRRPGEIGNADLIIIPGTKNTMGDMRWLRKCGLDEAIASLAKRGIPVFGICGGFQMLGRSISDPKGLEGGGSEEGLRLLPVDTQMTASKTRKAFDGVIADATGPLTGLVGHKVKGYEIHMGETTPFGHVNMFTSKGSGYCMGNVYGTYVHGFFDEYGTAASVVRMICKFRGKRIDTKVLLNRSVMEESIFDTLAETVRNSLDMDYIYKIIGKK